MAAYHNVHEDDDDFENEFGSGKRVLSIAYPEERYSKILA